MARTDRAVLLWWRPEEKYPVFRREDLCVFAFRVRKQEDFLKRWLHKGALQEHFTLALVSPSDVMCYVWSHNVTLRRGFTRHSSVTRCHNVA